MGVRGVYAPRTPIFAAFFVITNKVYSVDRILNLGRSESNVFGLVHERQIASPFYQDNPRCQTGQPKLLVAGCHRMLESQPPICIIGGIEVSMGACCVGVAATVAAGGAQEIKIPIGKMKVKSVWMFRMFPNRVILV